MTDSTNDAIESRFKFSLPTVIIVALITLAGNIWQSYRVDARITTENKAIEQRIQADALKPIENRVLEVEKNCVRFETQYLYIREALESINRKLDKKDGAP